MDQLNVGISILPGAAANIWNNGLNQNLAFLAQLLRCLPSVGQVWLLNGGDVEALPSALQFDSVDAPLVWPRDVTHEIDVVIELGATLPLEWLRQVRALGAKIVTLFVGHTYTGQSENPMFGRPGAAFAATPWHEIWTLPHHMKTSGPLLRTIGRVPVHAVPHIWSPLFLQRDAEAQRQQGRAFGFRPERSQAAGGWRLAIFEPNVSVVKNCFIPMLACDDAYRRRRDAVAAMMVMNTFHMKEHATFNRLASHLDLTRDGKASYEPRLAFAECMAVHALDAVVAHQWECGLNYAYYDALHGGYPLIHNSDFLQAEGVGFHYPGFQATRAAEALLEAWTQPAGFWDDYAAHARGYLAARAPDHPANLEAYAARLAVLSGSVP